MRLALYFCLSCTCSASGESAQVTGMLLKCVRVFITMHIIHLSVIVCTVYEESNDVTSCLSTSALSLQCQLPLSPCQSQCPCPVRVLCPSATPAALLPLPLSPPRSQTLACCHHSNRSSRGTQCLLVCHRDQPVQVRRIQRPCLR